MPVSEFTATPAEAGKLNIEHYIGDKREETAAKPKRRYPRTLKGWFFWTLMKLDSVAHTSLMRWKCPSTFLSTTSMRSRTQAVTGSSRESVYRSPRKFTAATHGTS